MRLDALLTEPVYRYYIWGGRRLHARWGKPLDAAGRLAESWEVADEAQVADGPWAGRTLAEVDTATDGALTGDVPHYPRARLPLLIKLSNAEADLSVQVHPDDALAAVLAADTGYPGKSEMYYIVDADPGAGIYYGLRPGVTLADVRATLTAGRSPADLLAFVPLAPGDVLYSPARTIHAIGKGVVYCEIQQNSDITYRLYDWDRLGADGKPRPLHVDQALAAAAERSSPLPRITPLALAAPNGSRHMMLTACPHFAVELFEGEAPQGLTRTRSAMRAITVLDGMVRLESGEGEPVLVSAGRSATGGADGAARAGARPVRLPA